MRVVIIGVLPLVLLGCQGITGSADDNRLRHVLVISKTAWYRHDAIPEINDWFVRLGESHGFKVTTTEDAEAFEPEKLRQYQAVIFNNTTDIGKSLNDAQKQAFVDWFRAGGAYVGIHAASVHHHTWPWYEQMLGANFNSDTEPQRARVTVEPDAAGHPAVEAMAESLFVVEEWMNFEASVRGLPDTIVLLSLDETSLSQKTVKPYFQDKGGRFMGDDHPISWAREFEGGRVFYTNFGHDLTVLLTEQGRRHVLGGLHWATGTKQQ